MNKYTPEEAAELALHDPVTEDEVYSALNRYTGNHGLDSFTNMQNMLEYFLQGRAKPASLTDELAISHILAAKEDSPAGKWLYDFAKAIERRAASAPAQQATPPQPVAAEVEKDARRYRWLRDQNWDDGQMCVVRDPIKNLRLGADCPSLIRLDEFIDAALSGTGSDESKKGELNV